MLQFTIVIPLTNAYQELQTECKKMNEFQKSLSNSWLSRLCAEIKPRYGIA